MSMKPSKLVGRKLSDLNEDEKEFFYNSEVLSFCDRCEVIDFSEDLAWKGYDTDPDKFQENEEALCDEDY